MKRKEKVYILNDGKEFPGGEQYTPNSWLTTPYIKLWTPEHAKTILLYTKAKKIKDLAKSLLDKKLSEIVLMDLSQMRDELIELQKLKESK